MVEEVCGDGGETSHTYEPPPSLSAVNQVVAHLTLTPRPARNVRFGKRANKVLYLFMLHGEAGALFKGANRNKGRKKQRGKAQCYVA